MSTPIRPNMLVTHLRKSFVGLLALALLASSLWAAEGAVRPDRASAATAVINNVSMRAPVYTSYDHSTGGGAWNSGTTTYVKGELLGSDYACGDFATFLIQLGLNETPTMSPSPFTAQITMDFTTDTTGQSGVALVPATSADHLRVNSGVVAAPGVGSGAGGSDGGFFPSGSGLTTSAAVVSSAGVPVTTVTQQGGAIFSSGSTQRLVFSVSGLEPGSTTIVRADARILCKANSTPTGNLQTTIQSVSVTAPASESVSSGNQTVNFRNAGNLAGLNQAVLSLAKTVSTDGTNCPGVDSRVLLAVGTVRYCYQVTNFGTSTATGVTVFDDNFTGIPNSVQVPLAASWGGSSSLTPQSLAGGGVSLYGQLDVLLATGGHFVNLATASATNAATVTADAVVDVQVGTVFAKTVTDSTGTCPGVAVKSYPVLGATQAVKYCYSLTNFSGSSIYSLSIVDDAGTPLVTPFHTVAPLTGLTDQGSGSAIDLADGATVNGEWLTTLDTATTPWINTATASYSATVGGEPVTATATARVNLVSPVPGLSISKSDISDTSPAAVGDVVDYQIVVMNSGQTQLTSVSVADPGATNLICTPSLPVAVLAIGDSISCTAQHTVTQGDIDNGGVDNTATASGTPPVGSVIERESSTSTPLLRSPELTVTKVQASPNPTRAGDLITYTITATNTGNVTLSAVTVEDANAAVTSCTPAIPVAVLAVADVITCSAIHTVTQDDVNAGLVDNVAGGSYTCCGPNGPGGPSGSAISGHVVTPIAPLPEITVTIEPVVPNPPSLPAGSTVLFRVVVRNSGNVILNNVFPVPTNFVINDCTPAIGSSLQPGEEMVCFGGHVVTPAESSANRVDVSVTAVGTDSFGTSVEAADPTRVTPPEQAGLLPRTGADFASATLWGVVLLGLGAVLLIMSRRRLW